MSRDCRFSTSFPLLAISLTPWLESAGFLKNFAQDEIHGFSPLDFQGAEPMFSFPPIRNSLILRCCSRWRKRKRLSSSKIHYNLSCRRTSPWLISMQKASCILAKMNGKWQQVNFTEDFVLHLVPALRTQSYWSDICIR